MTDTAEREAFERELSPEFISAWNARDWITRPVSDKEKAWRWWQKARAALPARAPEAEEAARYAERLAKAMHAKHFPENTCWKPLSGDLIGLLSQIDNMTAGLPLPARAPVGWVLVPREPTPEMQRRGVEAGVAAGSRGEKWVGAAWAAMLSAATLRTARVKPDAKALAAARREGLRMAILALPVPHPNAAPSMLCQNSWHLGYMRALNDTRAAIQAALNEVKP